MVGDIVQIETVDDKGTVIEISERKNALNRPPVANIDILFIIASVEDPKPNLYVLDKLSAFAEFHKIEPVIVFSKCDLGYYNNYLDIYSKSSGIRFNRFFLTKGDDFPPMDVEWLHR